MLNKTIKVQSESSVFSFSVNGINVFEHTVKLSNGAIGKGLSSLEALIDAVENCEYCDWLIAQELVK